MQIQPSAPRWGVLVYSSASPDIEPACEAALDEVLRANPAAGVAVAAQLGTAGGIRRISGSAEEMLPPREMSISWPLPPR